MNKEAVSIPKRLWQTHKVISNLLNGIYNKQIIVIRSGRYFMSGIIVHHTIPHCLFLSHKFP